MIRAYPQRIAEPSGSLGYDVFGKHSSRILLFKERQYGDLGLFQVTVGIHAADHHFRAYIIGRETCKIDGGAHSDSPATDHGTAWPGPGLDKAHTVPHFANAGIPLSLFAAQRVIRLAHAQMTGMGRFV